jgi:hypothetical protein
MWLFSNLIKTWPDNNFSLPVYYLVLLGAGNYRDHTGKTGTNMYSAYLAFRPLLLWFLNKLTMAPGVLIQLHREFNCVVVNCSP